MAFSADFSKPSSVLLYAQTASLRCPMCSFMTCSSIPLEYMRVAAVTWRLWFVYLPWTPAFVMIVLMVSLSLFTLTTCQCTKPLETFLTHKVDTCREQSKQFCLVTNHNTFCTDVPNHDHCLNFHKHEPLLVCTDDVSNLPGWLWMTCPLHTPSTWHLTHFSWQWFEDWSPERATDVAHLHLSAQNLTQWETSQCSWVAQARPHPKCHFSTANFQPPKR